MQYKEIKGDIQYIWNYVGSLLMRIEEEEERRSKIFRPIQPFPTKQKSTEKTGDLEGEEMNLNRLKFGEGTLRTRYRRKKDGTLSKYYEYRYMKDGRQVSISGKTKELILQRYRQEKDKPQKMKKAVRTDSLKVTEKTKLKDWLKIYYEQFKAPIKQENGEYIHGRKPTSQKQNLVYIEKRINPVLGSFPIGEIDVLTVQKFIYSIDHANTRKKIFDVLNGAMRKAKNIGYVSKNPLEAIEKPRRNSNSWRAYELEEQEIMLRELPKDYAQIFFFLCSTGLRIGEYLALSQKDIDFRRSVIHVTKTKNVMTGTIGTTKTETSYRDVFFEESLFNFFNIEIIGKYSYEQIKNRFSEKIKEFEPGLAPAHSTRHTFSSLCHAARINDKTIQHMLGHATLAMTMDTYTHLLITGSSPIWDYIKKLKKSLSKSLLE